MYRPSQIYLVAIMISSVFLIDAKSQSNNSSPTGTQTGIAVRSDRVCSRFSTFNHESYLAAASACA